MKWFLFLSNYRSNRLREIFAEDAFCALPSLSWVLLQAQQLEFEPFSIILDKSLVNPERIEVAVGIWGAEVRQVGPSVLPGLATLQRSASCSFQHVSTSALFIVFLYADAIMTHKKQVPMKAVAIT